MENICELYICHKYMYVYKMRGSLLGVVHLSLFPLIIKLSMGVFIPVGTEEETIGQDNPHQQSKATHH